MTSESIQSMLSDPQLLVAVIAAALVAIFLAVISRSSKGTSKKPKVYSHIVKGSAKGTSGDIHRGLESPDKLISEIPGQPNIKTLWDNFQHGVKQNLNGNCFGYRSMKGGKAGPYQWFSYKDVNAKAKAFGDGLWNLDLIPEVDGMRMLALYSKNRYEWCIGELGCFYHGGTTVPVYDTLGPDVLEYIINQTKLKAVLLSASEMKNLIETKGKCPSLKAAIQMESEVDPDIKKAAEKAGLTVYTFEGIIEQGKAKPQSPHPCKPEGVATFCYTSGTTGMPKGVLLTHSNCIATLAGAAVRGIQVTAADIHLSYLPLAHVLERMVMCEMLNAGAAIGFFQGNTLKLVEDLQELRPTIFISVPRLLNKIYDKVVGGAHGSKIKSFLLHTALNAKIAGLRKHGSYRHALWDKLVCDTIAKKVGLDRCWLMVTGSAPISGKVIDFLRVAFSTKVMEGYGQSETCALGTLTTFDDVTCGHVGVPPANVEVKLVSAEEMGYLVTDTVHEKGEAEECACVGRGEICFRGPGLFKGYYKDAAKTKETIDADGWCHTGDVGIWLTTGQLRIVDRLKNMFKLSQGEYVAAEKIENVYGTVPSVSQSFVYGDSLQSSLVAVVVPDFDVLAKWVTSSGEVKADIAKDHAKLCKDPKVIKHVLDEMTKVGKEHKLKGFELARAIYLTPDPFSIDNDMMTPTFKLKRHPAKLHFKKEIEAMYKSMEGR